MPPRQPVPGSPSGHPQVTPRSHPRVSSGCPWVRPSERTVLVLPLGCLWVALWGAPEALPGQTSRTECPWVASCVASWVVLRVPPGPPGSDPQDGLSLCHARVAPGSPPGMPQGNPGSDPKDGMSESSPGCPQGNPGVPLDQTRKMDCLCFTPRKPRGCPQRTPGVPPGQTPRMACP